MRVDDLGPKTWLLAGVATWGVLLWVLALAGMGDRVGEGETDGEAQRLPGAVPAAKERLGPLGQYLEIGQRPLFSEDRQPKPFTITGNGETPEVNTFDFVLTSVLITPQAQVAILRAPGDTAQPVRVKMGEAVQGAQQWSLAVLNPRQAVFRGPDGEKTLELRVFDGIGGVPPTAMNFVPPPPPPPGGVNVPGGVNGPGGMPPQPGQAYVQPGQIPPQGQMPPGAQPPGAGQPGVPAPVEQASTAQATADSGQQADLSSQQQLEAIRRRIEARRAQLRREQQMNQNAPSR